MGSGILVVGSINLDMVVSSPRIPGPGENVCGARFQMVAGGKGANQAVGCRRMGSRTYLLGRVGEDFFADYLLECLGSEGIVTMVDRTAQRSTGVALIVVEEATGVNTIVVDPGANMTLSGRDLDLAEDLWGEIHSVLFQLEIPNEVVSEGARRARKHGVAAVLDAGPPRGISPSLLEDFDVVSPNQDELSDIVGSRIGGMESTREAAFSLVQEGVPVVVVKMGAGGSMVVTAEGCWHVPPYEVRAVDATAAGDAFTAGLVTALGEGRPLKEAAMFANAAGALAVTVLGAQPSMPTRGQVEDLMRSQEIECSTL